METYTVKLTYSGSASGKSKILTYSITASNIQGAIQEAISNSNTGLDSANWTLTAVNARKSIFG